VGRAEITNVGILLFTKRNSAYPFELDGSMHGYESVDVLSFQRSDIQRIRPCHAIPHVVYVDKQFFDADLWSAFRSYAAARRQMSIDLPRSVFYADGIRSSDIPPRFPRHLYPYCTQAIMGLPVILLTCSVGVVFECGSQLCIYTQPSQGVVHATKELAFSHEGRLYKVFVLIEVSPHMASFTFLFGKYKGKVLLHE
jgi:hypothetical protein